MTKQTNYEEKFKELQGIIDQLDRQETPIDELAEKVKRGTSLINELNKKLKAVEKDVRNALKELEELDMEKESEAK